jgi:hypothetical protein
MGEELLCSKCGAKDETLKVKVKTWLTSEVEESCWTNFVLEKGCSE